MPFCSASASCGVRAVGMAPPKKQYTSEGGKYRIKFPGEPKTVSQTTASAIGELTVSIASYANSDGNTFMISYTDFPAEATKPENHATLFDGVRDAVTGHDGKLVGEFKKLDFGPDKLPERELVVDKGKQRVRFRAILRGDRLYQVAVIGTADFVSGKDATAFLNSLELTK